MWWVFSCPCIRAEISMAGGFTMPNTIYILDEVEANEREEFLEDWNEYTGDWE